MKKVIAEQLVGYLADVKLEDAKPRSVLVVTINEAANQKLGGELLLKAYLNITRNKINALV